ncbi:hypothetical protein PAMP_006521 [Pampus punctatissimus]
MLRRVTSMLPLLLLTVSSSSSRKVVGPAGEDVTLPCKYDFYSNGATSVCWGRGSVPLSGCINQIISTDGHKVIESSRVSSRYQLLGRLQDGDVSLTILNTTEEDAGQYGCRVEIKGWFNDEKHDIHLTIEKVSQSTASTTLNRETTHNYTENTTSHVTSVTESLSTSSLNSINTEKVQTTTGVTAVLVCVLFLLIALVTASAVTVIKTRWNQLKIPQQQQQIDPSVQFVSPPTNLQRHSPDSAVNIYQIDGDDYEFCP